MVGRVRVPELNLGEVDRLHRARQHVAIDAKARLGIDEGPALGIALAVVGEAQDTGEGGTGAAIEPDAQVGRPFALGRLQGDMHLMPRPGLEAPGAADHAGGAEGNEDRAGGVGGDVRFESEGTQLVEAATAEQAQDVAQRLVAVVKDRLTL